MSNVLKKWEPADLTKIGSIMKEYGLTSVKITGHTIECSRDPAAEAMTQAAKMMTDPAKQPTDEELLKDPLHGLREKVNV